MTKAYPQIRPAAAEDDLGVVISFDCEAPEVTETFINPASQKALSINPLNWKTDGTVADRSENPGSCFTNYDGGISAEGAELCGCYIDEARGVVKVTTSRRRSIRRSFPVCPTARITSMTTSSSTGAFRQTSRCASSVSSR
jgi:hypothetical protein